MNGFIRRSARNLLDITVESAGKLRARYGDFPSINGHGIHTSYLKFVKYYQKHTGHPKVLILHNVKLPLPDSISECDDHIDISHEIQKLKEKKLYFDRVQWGLERSCTAKFITIKDYMSLVKRTRRTFRHDLICYMEDTPVYVFGQHDSDTMLKHRAMVLDAWTPPQEGWHKLNVDASFIDFKDGFGKAGYGCIVRDSSGNFIDCWSGVLPYAKEEEEVHLMAVYYALCNAIKFGYSNIELEGNCEMVIKKINGSESFLDEYKHIYSDIYRMMNSFANLKLSFVYEEVNVFADELAREVMDNPINVEDTLTGMAEKYESIKGRKKVFRFHQDDTKCPLLKKEDHGKNSEEYTS